MGLALHRCLMNDGEVMGCVCPITHDHTEDDMEER